MPDTSPAAEYQGDGTSSAATNASDSPLETRRSSQEYTADSWTATAGPDRSGGMDDSAYRSPAQGGFQAGTVRMSQEWQPLREAGVASGLAHRPHLEDFRFGSTGRYARPNPAVDDNIDDEPTFSPTGDEPVGFEQFQLMEARRGSERKE